MCHYQGREPVITRELLDAACRAYFIEQAPADPALISASKGSDWGDAR